MTNWKHYAGSILLAGLLLQGCGDAEESTTPVVEKSDAAKAAQSTANTLLAIAEAPDQQSAKLAISSDDLATANNAEAFVKDALAQLVANGTITQAEADDFISRNDLNQFFLDAYAQNTTGAASPSRSIFDDIGDTIKDGLVDIMDSSIGGAITSATFEVVLNSEGVTVFMLDMARDSQTMTEIMIDALGRDWSLTNKMCPMLQTNKEFGEKFAALAYEEPTMAQFFFERVDAPMYGCLTDAMILSNDDSTFGSYDNPVEHSTNGYMGILLEQYATTFFIEPGSDSSNTSGYGRVDNFAGLMFTTGDVVTVDGNVTSGHGDANELINEQFFYSIFKTPGTTDAFVAAMKLLPDADVTMFMDEIFLGEQNTTAFGAGSDKVQGYYNIISIAGGMYTGIEDYGFSKYSGAFLGFAGLIPADRYMSYGSQFMSAGYFWAEQNGVSVWGSVVDGAKDIYANYTTDPETTVAAAPARSGGLGLISSPWIDDTLAVFGTAWDQLNIDLWPEDGFIAYYNAEAMKAYSTIIGSPDSNLSTTLETGESVNGFHGLLELAIREDMVRTTAVADMTEAEAAFELPAFSEITWNFAYTSAKTGVVGYWNNVVDAEWLANLSTNELVRNYFYPSADNLYIPSWLMAIDWLTVPANMTAGSYEAIDVSFDGGYMDVYFVSTNADLLTNIELDNALAPIKSNIEFTKIAMGSDSIIVVDENGQTLDDGLNVYKIRVVTPADVDAVLAALAGLGNSALNAIGIDTDNATQTTETASAE